MPDAEALGAWLAGQRWFAAKSRRITGVRAIDTVRLGGAQVLILEVALDDGAVQRYLTPLGPGPVVRDALDDEEFCRALLALVAQGSAVTGTAGELRGHPIVPRLLAVPAGAPIRRLPAEQSNTSVLFGRTILLKLFRRHVDGTNPDVEIGRFLTERAAFRGTPRLAGHVEYRRDGVTASAAIVQEFVDGARDGWGWMLEEAAAFFAEARAAGPRVRVLELAAPALAAVRRLGEQTAELHRALASDARDPAFAPEPISAEDVAAWSAAIRTEVEAARGLLGPGSLDGVPDPAPALRGLVGRQKIRHHGDFHLGQTLYRAATRSFMIIDFEGEPVRPLEERREKHAAVRDAAGLVRSLDYAAAAARRGAGDALAEPAAAWVREAQRAYLAGYRAAAAGAAFAPSTDAALLAAVGAFELEKAAYEVVYEANHRPDWLDIPRRGLLAAAARLPTTV